MLKKESQRPAKAWSGVNRCRFFIAQNRPLKSRIAYRPNHVALVGAAAEMASAFSGVRKTA
jgi:hypothetical protein